MKKTNFDRYLEAEEHRSKRLNCVSVWNDLNVLNDCNVWNGAIPMRRGGWMK